MKRILIVDDEPDVLKALKSSLERQVGFRVLTACDGQEALKNIEKDAPDIVILDLMMPKMSGEELIALLRKNIKTMNTPVIVSTVRRETSSMINLMNLGAQDYIMKPYDSKQLIKLINTYI